MSSISHIPSEIQAEFKINDDGLVTVSRRGLARLCGVDEKSIRQLLTRVKSADFSGVKSLETLATIKFQGAGLSDIAASLIIEYYAFDAKSRCTETAKTVFRSFAAIGLRSWVQTELGWNQRAKTPQRDDLRLSSIEVRKSTMKALHDAGFTEQHHYINVTQAAYKGLFGMNSKALRQARGIPEKANIREYLSKEELAALRLIEINLEETLKVIEFTKSSDVNLHINSVSASIRTSLAAGAVRGQLPG